MGPAFAVFGWSDNRAGTDDVFVQNVNLDGTLGPAASGPGEVANLIIDTGPGASQLTLTWAPSCSPGADYGVFEGTLASLRAGTYDHGPLVCSDALPSLEETIIPSATSTYYLVVPLDANAEGSHGEQRVNGVDQERPVGSARCVAAQTFGCP